jgi:hypothetical protein
MKLGFSRHIFEESTQTPNLMKTHPVGTELFHADVMKLIVTFRILRVCLKSTNMLSLFAVTIDKRLTPVVIRNSEVFMHIVTLPIYHAQR